MSKQVKEVRGTIDFSNFFDNLENNDPLKKEIRDAFALLKENCTVGDKIKHDLWPEKYVKEYRITNLWRYRLSSGWRLMYHIVGEPDGLIVYILEALSHSEYEKRFDY